MALIKFIAKLIFAVVVALPLVCAMVAIVAVMFVWAAGAVIYDFLTEVV